MSGHSKWATIKRHKGALDAKRSNMFTKLARAVSIAARDGKDPLTNFKLRMAIEKAKSFNVPKDNIERAILRGAGELADQGSLEEAVYEGYGAGGAALIIETITDNKKRTTTNIRHILARRGGSLAETNSVLWNFKRKGVIRIADEALKTSGRAKEAIELCAIDAGAKDIEDEDEGMVIYADPDSFMKIKEELQKKDIPIASAETELIPNIKIELSPEDKEKISALTETLEEEDDVANVYTNCA